jgi:hypothetical protein
MPWGGLQKPREQRRHFKFSREKIFARVRGEMSELAEGARLEIACTTQKVVPRVRIPLSPPNFAWKNLARLRRFAFQNGESALQITKWNTRVMEYLQRSMPPYERFLHVL